MTSLDKFLENLTSDETIKHTDKLAEAAPDLLQMLKNLTAQASFMNDLQHAGVKISPATWSGLYTVCNQAKALIHKVEAEQ